MGDRLFLTLEKLTWKTKQNKSAMSHDITDISVKVCFSHWRSQQLKPHLLKKTERCDWVHFGMATFLSSILLHRFSTFSDKKIVLGFKKKCAWFCCEFLYERFHLVLFSWVSQYICVSMILHAALVQNRMNTWKFWIVIGHQLSVQHPHIACYWNGILPVHFCTARFLLSEINHRPQSERDTHTSLVSHQRGVCVFRVV